MKVRKIFFYEGIELKIVEREEDYMNSGSKVTMTRVIAPNGGHIPMQIQHKATLKSIVELTIQTLDTFKRAGANIEEELTKEIQL